MIPVSKAGLGSSPNPASSYDEAVQRFEKIGEEESNSVTEVSRSRLMTHGEKTDQVYVLIHVWTNSPRQFVELGELLYERGHNVLILRLPYHGLKSHTVGELANVNLEDMRAYGDATIDIAQGLGDEVTVIGLSVGGAEASWIAQNRGDVQRVMTIASMFGLDHLPAFLDTFLMNLFLRVPNVNLISPSEPVREHVYRGQSTRGVAQVMHFGETVFAQARTTSPGVSQIIVLTNANDSTIDNRQIHELVDIWEQSGAGIVTYEFDASLGMPHDVIDVTSNSKSDLVYAKIIELLGE